VAIDIHNRTEVENQLWDEIEEAHLGMLGVAGDGPVRFQPMTPYCERDHGRLWFFTSRQAEIVAGLGDGRAAAFIVQSRSGKFQACIAGELVEDADRARIDRFWNSAASAYFPRGKDDPDLTMLSFDCGDAQIWRSDAGPLRFAWEVAKANLTHTRPDVGETTSVRLS
jgi:general stress protein 26